MEELKEWLINEINSINIDYYNESVYAWSKGYKKALLETFNVIKRIDSKKSKINDSSKEGEVWKI